MADVAILDRLDINYPGMEVRRIEASDGEEYVAETLKEIEAASLTLNEDTNADHNVTFSGQTATINIVGGADVTCTLVLYGRQ